MKLKAAPVGCRAGERGPTAWIDASRRVRRMVFAAMAWPIALPAAAPQVPAPQPAQTRMPPAFVWCANKDNDYSPEVAINGCTVAIEQGIETPHNRAVAYNNRGLAYADKGDFARAVADYSEAIRAEPTLALAFNNRGLARAEQGDFGLALADFTQAI